MPTPQVRDVIVGIDAGTSLIKTVAFTHEGSQLGNFSLPNLYRTSKGDHVEQDMSRTWDDTTAALDAYQTRRRPKVRRVQDAAGMLGRLGEVRNPALRTIRDIAIRLVLGRFGADDSMRAGQQEEPVWLESVARRRRET